LAFSNRALKKWEAQQLTHVNRPLHEHNFKNKSAASPVNQNKLKNSETTPEAFAYKKLQKF